MIETLISEYRAAAIAHGNGTMSGNSRKTNRAYNDLRKSLSKIAHLGEDTALLELFSDEETWVQVWAATHSLKVDEDKAVAKLKTLVDANIPIVSMTARYTIQEWEKGGLSFRS